MGYSLNAVQAEAVLQALKQNYSVYAPKRFPKQGRYSDTDVIKYAEVEHYEDIRSSPITRPRRFLPLSSRPSSTSQRMSTAPARAPRSPS